MIFEASSGVFLEGHSGYDEQLASARICSAQTITWLVVSDAAHVDIGGRPLPRPDHTGPTGTVAHRVLLITLDAAGRETAYEPDDPRAIGHPQTALTAACETPSGELRDASRGSVNIDELPPARRWGCSCGWRGDVRDVAGRYYRPQVGDGGNLGARRVARHDRDNRGELDAHLAKATRSPQESSDPALSAATPGTPSASAPVSPDLHPAARPGTRRPRRPLTLEPARTTAPSSGDGSGDTAETHGSGEHGRLPAPQPPPGQATEEAEQAAANELEAAVAAARRARAALETAEATLDGAVQRARAEGASWRAIARRVGTDHRSVQQRWGDPGNHPGTL